MSALVQIETPNPDGGSMAAIVKIFEIPSGYRIEVTQDRRQELSITSVANRLLYVYAHQVWFRPDTVPRAVSDVMVPGDYLVTEYTRNFNGRIVNQSFTLTRQP